jgi:phage tail sheath protein FI
VTVPASVAAMGAIAFNDKMRYPWFAPAGFNRASLDFVKNVEVRLNVDDRDLLSDARINPIATFPRNGYVIWGQKTLQIKRSALDRINVRRMVIEVKRIVIDIARRITFEQNTPAIRNRFTSLTTIQLGLIQAQQGIDKFKVIMNETNNTREDIELNKLNGKVIIVPTKTIETIAVDFVITRSGVEFV